MTTPLSLDKIGCRRRRDEQDASSAIFWLPTSRIVVPVSTFLFSLASPAADAAAEPSLFSGSAYPQRHHQHFLVLPCVARLFRPAGEI